MMADQVREQYAIGGPGNYYSGLSVRLIELSDGSGECQWSIDNYDGENWSLIPNYLYEALVQFEAERRVAILERGLEEDFEAEGGVFDVTKIEMFKKHMAQHHRGDFVWVPNDDTIRHKAGRNMAGSARCPLEVYYDDDVGWGEAHLELGDILQIVGAADGLSVRGLRGWMQEVLVG